MRLRNNNHTTRQAHTNHCHISRNRLAIKMITADDFATKPNEWWGKLSECSFVFRLKALYSLQSQEKVRHSVIMSIAN